MAARPELLTKEEKSRFTGCPVRCTRDPHKITSLADYLAVVSDVLKGKPTFWFRGHREMSWRLVPSALRYETSKKRKTALRLIGAFKRVAEIKIDRPPGEVEHLKWMQLAQHYGIPTRLLDWTQSATYALYFACEREKGVVEEEPDGIVFLVDPENLSQLPGGVYGSSLDGVSESVMEKYLGVTTPGRLRTIAINPVWNSARLVVQRGVFTLHGSTEPLDVKRAPSLYGIPILHSSKAVLRAELGHIGVDEMTIFPELEHACSHLKRHAGLE